MRRSMWCVLACFLCVSLPLAAQKVTGTIAGVVSDPAGAVISGADVSVTNPATGAVRTAKTSDRGEYAFADLPAGSYDLTVKQPNFKEYVSKGVQLFVSSTTTVNVSLTVGSATEQMTVEANAVQVETSTGAVGNVVEGNQVRELPLNGRSFVQLTQLMPGVSAASNFDSKNKGLMAGVDFSVNGNSTTGNIFMVDGVNNNDIGSNRTILVYPSIDAIQEFKVLRNSYGPEYGQAMGAIINIVTRGGTNQFHGGAYYFGRNDLLNATDWFNNFHQAKKDVLRRNDWGYNIGGPVVKDKLFFFWSEEWNRELRGKLRSQMVPTAAEKNGDFSQIRQSCGENIPRDPNNPDNATNIFTSIADINNHGYTGNQLSNTGNLLVTQLFPDENTPGDCNNWNVSLTAPIYWRQESVRADYKIGKTWSILGRYTQDHWSQPAPSTLGFWGDDPYPSVESDWIQPGYQATVKVTKLLGSSAVNDFQVSYAANRITVNVAGSNPGLIDSINAAQQPFFPYSQKFDGTKIGYPVFWGGVGNGTSSDSLWTQGPWHNNEELYILKDDFSKVTGAHTFKVGFLASNNKKNELVNCSSCEAPNYWGAQSTVTPTGTFKDGGSGNGIFNTMWNQVLWGWGELQTNPFTLTRWHDYEFYFGDTWKARRNLTVEYGVRWSLLRNPFAAKDRIASFQQSLYNPALGTDPCNGMLVVPGTHFCEDNGFAPGIQGQNRSLKDNNNHMIAPRIGIAWDPRGDGKMAFRAGVGQFFQRERLSNYLYLASNTPFALNAGGTGDNNHGRSLDIAPDPTQVSISGSPSFGLDPKDLMPNTWQWNATFEREIMRDSKLEVAYVANRGIHLLRYIDANPVPVDQRLAFALGNSNSLRPAGSFGFINYGKWNAGSNYQALQVLFRTRMKALDAQFAYTWSKSIADTDITNSGGANQTSLLLDQTNPRHDYGPTTINRPHVFTANLVYNTPALKQQNAFVRGALGGWELASILNYTSGPSWTVNTNNSADNVPGGITGTGTSQNNDRPNRLLQDCRSHGGRADQWWNPDAFTLDNYQIGGLGNSGVGSCSGPGLANTDFSVYKNFKAGERVTLQFRFEFYNLFNKAQFRTDSIDTNINDHAVGCNAGNINVANSPCFGHAVDTLGWSFGANQFSGNVYGNQSFGLVRNDKGPREIQYALKINF
jgi:hypothetical protein